MYNSLGVKLGVLTENLSPGLINNSLICKSEMLFYTVLAEKGNFWFSY